MVRGKHSRAAVGQHHRTPTAQAAFRMAHIPFYASCKLTQYNAKRQAGGSGGEPLPKRVFLTLEDSLERSSEYSRDDLWLLGSAPSLEEVPSKAREGCSEWLIIARSLWHGPNNEGRSGPSPVRTCLAAIQLAVPHLLVNNPSWLCLPLSQFWDCNFGAWQPYMQQPSLQVVNSGANTLQIACRPQANHLFFYVSYIV